MADLTDVMPALISFQELLSAGGLRPPPSRSFTDSKLRLFTDLAEGKLRLTFTRINGGGTVTAFLNAFREQPIDGLPCFAVGYAVPEALRGQGRATDILTAVIAEFSHMCQENGIKAFAVEAVVGLNNPASQAVARKVLADTPKEITDAVSGVPALQYVRKVML